MYGIMKRWRLIDYPDSVKFKKVNPFIYKKITDFRQMPIDQQKVFKEVKHFVCKILGETKCYAFGSRVNGNWLPESDYDILIYSNPSKEIKLIILRKDFKVKVDIRYSVGALISNMIEII